jgi:hypothetical protein
VRSIAQSKIPNTRNDTFIRESETMNRCSLFSLSVLASAAMKIQGTTDSYENGKLQTSVGLLSL